MQINIHLDTDNAAFNNDAIAEVKRVINAGLDKLSPYETNIAETLIDINGNSVGQVTVTL